MARYELVEGNSSKFWEIALDGASFTTSYGRIGTAGQSTTKDFADEETAQKEHDKLVLEKTKKGYALASGRAAAAPKPPAERPAAAKKPFDDEGDDEEDAPPPKKAPPEAAPTAPAAGARMFELVEGTSSKFWEIALAGSAFTTRYGKIGTAGQSSTKDFGSEENARKEYDKLVLEKTKKGYAEK